ncbi:MAG: alpha/beta hydrolase [Rickettsiales bacterium]
MIESKSDMATTLPELPPKSGTVRRLVIFLHGVGADGNDLLSLGEFFDLPDTQYVSPHAPQPFDMAPFGHQWFSLLDRSPASLLSGAQTSAPWLNDFIDEQMVRFKLTPADVALVGFSQGTMMALYAGLRRAVPLAGIVGYSGALVAPELLSAQITSRPPVCLIHGEEDVVVPFGALAQAEDALRAANVPVEAHARPMLGHGIDEKGLQFAAAFLKRCLAI